VDTKCCLYCNREECLDEHLDLKIVTLLHKSNIWIRIARDIIITRPLLTKIHGDSNALQIVFVVPLHAGGRINALRLIENEWQPISTRDVGVEPAAFRETLLQCPTTSCSLPSLFHSSLSTACRNDLELPDLEFQFKIKSLNKIWNCLRSDSATEKRFYTPTMN
jgi:hypothetical protein